MTTTVRLLSYYDGNSFNTIVRLPDALAATFIAQGNATLDLTGGINRPPSLPTRANRGPAQLIYSATGQFLGLGDTQNNLLLNASGATLPGGLTAPGAPTGLTLTALAGGISAAFTAPANNGGDTDLRYKLVLSNGIEVTGGSSPIAAASPAGLAVTGVLYAVNGVGTSPASNTSNSATPTGVAPSVPATAITLTGPTSATVGTASGAYTVALSPVGGTVASPVTVTPTPVTGVTFAPTSVQLSTASPSATFTETATTAGTKAIAVTSTGGLSAPAAINLVVAAAGVAPTVATQPAITGTPTVGTPLSITSATFNGTPTPTVTRTIKVAGVTVATGPQASTNYTPVSADVGKVPTVEATATNSEGSVTTNVVSGAAIIAAAGGATWRNVANKVVNMGQAYPAYKQVSVTTVHQNFQDATALKVVDSNWGTNAGSEPLSGGDNTVSVSVEYPIGSTPQRFLFGGAVTGTNPSGSDLESDALTLSVMIPKNTPYKIHRYITNPTAVFLAGGLTTAEGDVCKFAASGLVDVTGQAGGQTGTSTGTVFTSPPSAILAFHNGPSVAGVGDSRFAGVLDNTTDATKYPIGQIGRLMRPLYPYIQYGLSGETQTQFRVANMPRRIAFIIKYCTHVVVEHAINGFSTAAAAEVNVGVIWKIFADAGLKVYQTTTTPRVTPTAGGTYSATNGSDQVYSTVSDELIVWNTRLLTVPAPLTGTINVTPFVTLPGDPKKWNAPGYTSDGLHETTLANLAIRDGAPITSTTFA